MSQVLAYLVLAGVCAMVAYHNLCLLRALRRRARVRADLRAAAHYPGGYRDPAAPLPTAGTPRPVARRTSPRPALVLRMRTDNPGIGYQRQSAAEGVARGNR